MLAVGERLLDIRAHEQIVLLLACQHALPLLIIVVPAKAKFLRHIDMREMGPVEIKYMIVYISE